MDFADLFLEELKELSQYSTVKSWDFNNVSSGTGGMASVFFSLILEMELEHAAACLAL